MQNSSFDNLEIIWLFGPSNVGKSKTAQKIKNERNELNIDVTFNKNVKVLEDKIINSKNRKQQIKKGLKKICEDSISILCQMQKDEIKNEVLESLTKIFPSANFKIIFLYVDFTELKSRWDNTDLEGKLTTKRYYEEYNWMLKEKAIPLKEKYNYEIIFLDNSTKDNNYPLITRERFDKKIKTDV